MIGALVPVIAACAYFASTPVASAPSNIRCDASTPTTLSVSWPAEEDTDMYYVQLASSADSRPYALQTSATNHVTLIDLVPGTRWVFPMRCTHI